MQRTVQAFGLDGVNSFLEEYVHSLCMDVVHQADSTSSVEAILKVRECDSNSVIIMLIVESINISAKQRG